VLSALFLLSTFGGTAAAQTRQMPIDYFTDMLNPAEVQGWTDPANGNLMVIDAYGHRNSYWTLGLPTVTEGNVSIRSLKDGTERVTVNGHTRDAFCVVVNGPDVLFGYTLGEVLSNIGSPALGDISYRIVYAPQPAGQFDPAGAILESFSASVSCDGPLRPASGYPLGTSGFAQTRQTGLYSTGAPGGCPPEKDGNCFPAEKIQVKARQR
jgi:hypothetical protein